jgi:hypothetical protein
LAEAIKRFDELKTGYANQPTKALNTPKALEGLAQVLALAPNHLSAVKLQQLAKGETPSHLTLITTIEETMTAADRFDPLLEAYDLPRPAPGPIEDGALTAVHKDLARVKRLGDPAAAPVIDAVDQFCTAYVRSVIANQQPTATADSRKRMHQAVQQKSQQVRAAIEKVISDRNVIDKLLHHR